MLHRLAVASIVAVLTNPLRAADTGRISGHVEDQDGRPVAGAMVVVLDQQKGMPVERDSFQPFTEESWQNIATAITQQHGEFTIDNVKPGVYRLLAQSWEDAKKPAKKPLDVNGRVVRIHGLVENVAVPSAAAGDLEFRPLGTATLDITTDPQAPNDETLLVVSRAPLAADPILALAAWSGDFMPKLIAANRMPHGRTTVHGLPDGAVHMAAMSFDNNPGFGGATAALKPLETTTATVPMIASWSDGHKTPPKHLEALVAQVRKMNPGVAEKLMREQHPDLAKALATPGSSFLHQLAMLAPYLERKVEIASGQSVSLKDLAAADGYAGLLRSEDERAERLKRERLKQLGIDPSVSYEAALRELHGALGKNYPCFELKHIDWDQVGRRLLPQAAKIDNDEQFGLLCLMMVAALEDSHAQLLPAAAKLPEVPVPTWGAGFACLVDDRAKPVVYFVAVGSSADAAGVKIGMTVSAINGKPANEAIDEMANQLSRYVGYSSDRYLRYDAFRIFARQFEPRAAIQLDVVDTDGHPRSFSVQAAARSGYLPRLPVPIEGISDTADVTWKMLTGDIGYIYVRRIGGQLIESLDAAVEKLNAARGLVIDVRGNSGGGFDAARAHRNFAPDDAAEPARPRFGGNIAVLIDARCISAGEGWASWFCEKPNVRFFGETTAGASSRKTTYTLTNGLFSARYPVKAYTGFLDRPIERQGLEPDVPLMHNAADLAAERDTVLEAARKHLLEPAKPPQ